MAAAPAIERYELKNGLKVVLAPDRVTPGVSVVVRYGVGSAHEPAGYRGMSHLLEHLTFRGSRHVAPLQSMAILQDLGAVFNATTREESTEYLTQVPAQGLETVLWLESERMAFTLGRLDQAALDIERRIVDNENRQRYQGLDAMAERYSARALYGEGHPFVGKVDAVDDMSAIDLRRVQWFFQSSYRPDNALLVLVGQFDSAQARSLIEQYFGPVVSPRLARVSLQPAPPRLCGTHRLGLGHMAMFGHLLRITWPLPAAGSSSDRASVDALVELLRRRLNGLLVERGTEVAGVRVWLSSFTTHQLLTVDLELHEEGDAAVAEETTLREAHTLATQEPSARELSTVVAQLVSRSIFEREDGLERAWNLADGRDPDAEAAALRTLPASQVLRAAGPLAGHVFVLHAWSSSKDNNGYPVEKSENPCLLGHY